MRDQLYRGYANATALSNSPVVSALGSGIIDSYLIEIINLFSKTYIYKSLYNVVWSLVQTQRENMK